MPIIITRTLHAAKRTSSQLRQAGAATCPIIISPLLKILPISQEINLETNQEVVFTSENAVLAAPVPAKDMLAWCVGERTAQVARNKGFTAVAANGNAELLVKLILQSKPKKSLIWLHGKSTAIDIKLLLDEAGLTIRSEVIYDQIRCQLSPKSIKLLQSTACVLPVYSPRTATILSEEAADLPNLDHQIICNSKRIKENIKLNWRIKIVGNFVDLINTTAQISRKI